MNGTNALAAGWLLLLSTALFAVLGVFLGDLAQLKFVGGLAGGVLGTIIGFILVWRVFVVPENEAVSKRDYSGIKPLDDDDDEDSW